MSCQANETFVVNSNLYSEFFYKKNINYYIFEQKEESITKTKWRNFTKEQQESAKEKVRI